MERSERRKRKKRRFKERDDGDRVCHSFLLVTNNVMHRSSLSGVTLETTSSSLPGFAYFSPSVILAFNCFFSC
jgi:hypothetical protein